MRTGTLRVLHLKNTSVPDVMTGRATVQRIVEREFGVRIEPSRIRFVPHHRAHAVSAFYMSGFDDALVVTLDGEGEGVSGTVWSGRGLELELLRSVPEQHSLGLLYREVIRFHGYDMFDGYKVMGLAPYGRAARFRHRLERLYELLPDGEYRLRLDRVPDLYACVTARRKGEAFTQEHLDLAASLQEAVEIVGGHLLRHFARGHRAPAIVPGGRSGAQLFDERAGRLLGTLRSRVRPAGRPRRRLRPWRGAGGAPGASPGSGAWRRSVTSSGDRMCRRARRSRRQLAAWTSLVTVEEQADVCATAARLIGGQRVIGWVQGRSEFGPRALGNRSILADPRPPEHKDIINRMVKKRESYRPFAPSVVADRVGEFFVVPPAQTEFPYMSVVLEVRPDKRELLGAVTHVDGTARVQTVDRASNERYWRLIDAVGRLTGVPVVLNTSFNNHAEPIVDSVFDAMVCFLTTDLHALIVGDFLLLKRDVAWETYLDLRVSLPPAMVLRTAMAPGRPDRQGRGRMFEVRAALNPGKSTALSEAMYTVLTGANGTSTLGALCDAASIDPSQRRDIVDEVRNLWSARVVRLEP